MDQIIWTKEQDKALAEFYLVETDLRSIKKQMNNVFNVPQLRKRLTQLKLVQQVAPINMTPGRHAAVNAKLVSGALPFPKLVSGKVKAAKGGNTTIERDDSQSPRRSSRRMSVLGGVNRTGI
jgi:hypothetical protein